MMWQGERGGEGGERGAATKEEEARGRGEEASDDDAQSFSLACTPRIPNLGHTDTNAISVPRPSEAARGRGGKTSRGIRAGVVRKLRICGLRHGRCALARTPSPNPSVQLCPDFLSRPSRAGYTRGYNCAFLRNFSRGVRSPG